MISFYDIDQYGRIVQVVDGYYFDGYGNPLEMGSTQTSSTIYIRQDGVTKVSNVTTFNFIGATVVDAGGGVADITI